MKVMLRPRRLANAALTVVLTLALAACTNQDLPNTTFDPHTEFGRDIDDLWDKLLFWGTLVFVFVEAALIFVVVRYRRREGRPEPKHVHGNTTLEILWTVLPAVILVLIAVPTVRTIFTSQATAPANAIRVNVIGHQWWWEFEYPQYGFKTANELYLPNGRTVAFELRTQDVLHSFWIPQLGGKRDLITNRTNYLWFTPDSALGSAVWNGFCAEYCGASHANMKFRAFTVSEPDFERWAAHQRSGPVVTAPGSAATTAPGAPGAPQQTGATPSVGAQTAAAAAAPGQQPAGRGATPAAGAPAAPPPAQPGVPGGAAGPVPNISTDPAAGIAMSLFPQLPEHAIPKTPIPAGITFQSGLAGNVERGRQLFARSPCVGCHVIQGVSMSPIGPTLTHVGSRTTIAAGLYPNDAEHLSAWIKNAPAMKPGSKMPPQGKGLRDPNSPAVGTLDDAQIADLVAYLLALK
jgi:cytochrome c oxidase subunit 2